jgi:methylenetetrahydrofolate dehydrogenase (NADP+)/methenyltetrahydrofolate cyclohydrolase
MLLSGKDVRDAKIEELKKRIEKIDQEINFTIIKVGNNQASEVYVRNKIKFAHEIGINPILLELEENISQNELEQEIEKINKDNTINGLFIQLPLPNHIDEEYVCDLVDPSKDVDGFTTTNLGKLILNEEGLYPCTVEAIIDILNFYKIEIEGKNITIIGRSNIVGKPLAIRLINKGATVTSCNSRTKNIKEHTKNADIVITAIGKAKYFTEDFFENKDTVVIDVGINRDQEGKLCGDVDFKNVENKVKAITPVPGGVGIMTVTKLIDNIIKTKELSK